MVSRLEGVYLESSGLPKFEKIRKYSLKRTRNLCICAKNRLGSNEPLNANGASRLLEDPSQSLGLSHWMHLNGRYRPSLPESNQG
jgi:hypothetical protein